MSFRTRRRPALAAMWMLVVLAVLSAVLAATTWQHLATRRMVDQRQKQLQAAWLARAGVEWAAGRLLSNPAGYQGEAISPLPGSNVRVTVRHEPASAKRPGHAAGTVGLLAGPTALTSSLAAASWARAGAALGDTYLVTAEARYRTDEPPVVARSLTQRFRRVSDKGGVRLDNVGTGRDSTE